MRAWTVDADDIRVAEDFDESLLYRTPEIDAFLMPGRDDKFIVPAPTGNDLFNVKKQGTPEPDLWVRLYRLES
jgi:hypothetical protein